MKTRKRRKMRTMLMLTLVSIMLIGSSIQVQAAQRNFDGYDAYIYYIGYLRASYEDGTSSFSAYTGDANDDVYTKMQGTGVYTDTKRNFTISIIGEGWNSCYYSNSVDGAMVSAECSYYLSNVEIKEVTIYV